MFLPLFCVPNHTSSKTFCPLLDDHPKIDYIIYELKKYEGSIQTKLSRTFEVMCFLPHTATVALTFG